MENRIQRKKFDDSRKKQADSLRKLFNTQKAIWLDREFMHLLSPILYGGVRDKAPWAMDQLVKDGWEWRLIQVRHPSDKTIVMDFGLFEKKIHRGSLFNFIVHHDGNLTAKELAEAIIRVRPEEVRVSESDLEQWLKDNGYDVPKQGDN